LKSNIQSIIADGGEEEDEMRNPPRALKRIPTSLEIEVLITDCEA
jgi:hypothetical protein